jgi:four helix bundle protein
MTLLEIFRRVKWISNSDYKELQSEAIEIASMIKGLINSLKKSLSA